MIPNAHPGMEREGALARRAAGRTEDLIICRALCDLFNAPALKEKIAFRGGHSMHLVFKFAPEADSQATLEGNPITRAVTASDLNSAAYFVRCICMVPLQF